MSTSFPQDVLRRIRALEQGLAGTQASVTTIEGGGAPATFPITADDGTYTYSLTDIGSLDLQTADDFDGSHIAFFSLVLDGAGAGSSQITMDAESPSGTHSAHLNVQAFAAGTGSMRLTSDGQGASFFVSNGSPSGITGMSAGDITIDNSSPRLYQYDGSGWQPIGWADSFVSASPSSSYTASVTTARVHKLTLGGTVTLTLSGAVSGYACGLTLYLIQDGTGSRTVTWPGSVKWPAGTAPTLSTAASSVDIVVLESTDGGTTWYGNLAGKGYA